MQPYQQVLVRGPEVTHILRLSAGENVYNSAAVQLDERFTHHFESMIRDVRRSAVSGIVGVCYVLQLCSNLGGYVLSQ